MLTTAMLDSGFDLSGPVAAQWDELCDELAAPPWMRPGWIDSWWRAFGKGRLEIFGCWRDGRLAAVLPMQSQTGELKSASNTETPAFGILGVDADARMQVARSLLARRARRLTLYPLTDDRSGMDEVERASAETGYRTLGRKIGRSPYIPINSSWDEYSSRLSRKVLAELRRRRRRLTERGSLSLTIETGPDGIDALLDEAFAVEARQWKGRAGTAIASSPDRVMFYRELAAWAAARGSLRLALLRLDDELIAFDYSLEDANVHYLLKTGYEPAYHAYGPGVLIRYEMIRGAFERGLSTYEFLGHEETWKRRWAFATRELVLLRAFAPSLTGLADWGAMAYARPVVRRLIPTRSR